MSTNVLRKDVAHFLLTATSPSDVWSRIGDGITDATINANPEKTTEAYIHESNATTTLERYAPNMPVTGKAKYGDAVFNYILNLWNTRAVGTAAETYILNVEYFKTPVSTDQYPAQKQKVVISIDTPPGGAGGATAQIGYTIDYIGDPTNGLYDVSAGTFTPS